MKWTEKNCTEIPPPPLKKTSIKVEEQKEFLLAGSTLQSAGANFNTTLIVPASTNLTEEEYQRPRCATNTSRAVAPTTETL